MKKQSGFSVVFVIVALCIIGLVGFAGYRVANNVTSKQEDSTATDEPEIEAELSSNNCSEKPILALPVDSGRIESILYPGQVRGGNFKPHGGFKLSGSNEATVTLPLDAKVISGVRYYESDEIQYMFDFETDCGYRIRLDHLNTLSSNMQKLADQLPEPTTDSRTTNIESDSLKAGTVIATKVGFVNTSNVSFDMGFYDYNTQNEASKAADWPTSFEYTTDNSKHGLCWFDYLSEDDELLVRNLPATDGQQGKNSVYCE